MLGDRLRLDPSQPAPMSEQSPLERGLKRIGVEAQVAEMVGELRRAVRAEDLARLDAAHRFDQLVVIGVVGERQRMIDAQAILRARVGGPTGDGDRDRAAQDPASETASQSAAA